MPPAPRGGVEGPRVRPCFAERPPGRGGSSRGRVGYRIGGRPSRLRSAFSSRRRLLSMSSWAARANPSTMRSIDFSTGVGPAARPREERGKEGKRRAEGGGGEQEGGRAPLESPRTLAGRAPPAKRARGANLSPPRKVERTRIVYQLSLAPSPALSYPAIRCRGYTTRGLEFSSIVSRKANPPLFTLRTLGATNVPVVAGVDRRERG